MRCPLTSVLMSCGRLLRTVDTAITTSISCSSASWSITNEQAMNRPQPVTPVLREKQPQSHRSCRNNLSYTGPVGTTTASVTPVLPEQPQLHRSCRNNNSLGHTGPVGTITASVTPVLPEQQQPRSHRSCRNNSLGHTHPAGTTTTSVASVLPEQPQSHRSCRNNNLSHTSSTETTSVTPALQKQPQSHGGSIDPCNSRKRFFPSRLHELHEPKVPFVSRIEFIRSKFSNLSAHVCGFRSVCSDAG